jgi:hypothetical protein
MRTIFGLPIRKETTECMYSDKLSLLEFREFIKDNIESFTTEILNIRKDIGSSDKYIEDWCETFLAWCDIEEERK